MKYNSYQGALFSIGPVIQSWNHKKMLYRSYLQSERNSCPCGSRQKEKYIKRFLQHWMYILQTTVLHGLNQVTLYSIKPSISRLSNWECFIPDQRLPLICKWTGNFISIIYWLLFLSVIWHVSLTKPFFRQVTGSNVVYFFYSHWA